MTYRDSDLRHVTTESADPRSLTPIGNNGNPFANATMDPPIQLGHKFIPRPQADDPRYAETLPDYRDVIVARHQEQWDSEHERSQALNAHVAEIRGNRDAEREAANDAAEAKRNARIAGERALLETRVKERFLAQPAASEADFARLKDQLIDAELIRSAGSTDVLNHVRHSY